MEAFVEVASLLGVSKPKDRLHFVDMVERGLPLRSLERISERFAPADATFKYRIVPKATFARYVGHADRLNAVQSTRIARLAEIWSLARKIWRTDERARDFLLRPHQLLKARRPLDVALENELGGQLVRDILGRLEYGTAV